MLFLVNIPDNNWGKSDSPSSSFSLTAAGLLCTVVIALCQSSLNDQQVHFDQLVKEGQQEQILAFATEGQKRNVALIERTIKEINVGV